MSDHTPAEALARARWDRELDPDHPWYVAWDDVSPRLRQEQVEFAEADIELLAAAGFQVTRKPDDTTRELAQRLIEHADFADPDDIIASDMRAAAALLDGQPEDRPDRCPTCDSDDPACCNTDGERHRFGSVISESCCTDSWHVGSSGDTR